MTKCIDVQEGFLTNGPSIHLNKWGERGGGHLTFWGKGWKNGSVHELFTPLKNISSGKAVHDMRVLEHGFFFSRFRALQEFYS